MLPLARLLLISAVALPGVGPGDDRVAVDPSSMPWRAIGRVQTELGGRCTGFLVAPRTVVTAAHCLYLRRPNAYVRPGSVHFLLGYARGGYVAHARIAAFRVGPGYDPARPHAASGADWALLTLDAPLGTPERILGLAATPPAPGTPLQLGGYGQDRAEVIAADLDCSVKALLRDDAGQLLVQHSCNGAAGTSGAPLLARGADGGWLAVGIQVAAFNDQAGNLAVPTASVLRQRQ